MVSMLIFLDGTGMPTVGSEDGTAEEEDGADGHSKEHAEEDHLGIWRGEKQRREEVPEHLTELEH